MALAYVALACPHMETGDLRPGEKGLMDPLGPLGPPVIDDVLMTFAGVGVCHPRHCVCDLGTHEAIPGSTPVFLVIVQRGAVVRRAPRID